MLETQQQTLSSLSSLTSSFEKSLEEESISRHKNFISMDFHHYQSK